jgi:hypothetical protein
MESPDQADRAIQEDELSFAGQRPTPDVRGTPTAIGIATGIGIFIGTFSPFLHWIGALIALVGAIVVPAGLSYLATNCYILVGFGYAAGVAAAALVISSILFGFARDTVWWGLPLAFLNAFAILSVVSPNWFGTWRRLEVGRSTR